MPNLYLGLQLERVRNDQHVSAQNEAVLFCFAHIVPFHYFAKLRAFNCNVELGCVRGTRMPSTYGK